MHAPEQSLDENELIRQRRTKLENISKKGIYAYGGRYETTSTVKALKDDFAEGKTVSLAGRIMAVRFHGKSSFCDIKDSTARIQAYFKADMIGAALFALLNDLDIGDFIGIKGDTFKTRTGEPTIVVKEFKILAKSLRPLPEKWHGLQDVEERFRKR
ncbi:MAG: OB-fold nucleic acid binding domain-containing protein, partial [Candidatus Omnitrophica bacterium]|nr:OB-fold nucleic acid binding domain-containing protein [Candidatus Omnitrophota bacterium]